MNIGPEPDGSIPEESVEIFKTIGKWMKVNGDAIYGTRANPFDKEFQWGGRVTRKGDNKLYLILYSEPENGKIELPCSFEKGGWLKHIYCRTGKKVKLSQFNDKNQCILDVSHVRIEQPATVIELTGKWKL